MFHELSMSNPFINDRRQFLKEASGGFAMTDGHRRARRKTIMFFTMSGYRSRGVGVGGGGEFPDFVDPEDG